MSEEKENPCQYHTKNDGSWWERDARGIELCRVCEDCIAVKLSRYNPGCLTREQQRIIRKTSDATYEETVEEQIEPEDDSMWADDGNYWDC